MRGHMFRPLDEAGTHRSDCARGHACVAPQESPSFPRKRWPKAKGGEDVKLRYVFRHGWREPKAPGSLSEDLPRGLAHLRNR